MSLAAPQAVVERCQASHGQPRPARLKPVPRCAVAAAAAAQWRAAVSGAQGEEVGPEQGGGAGGAEVMSAGEEAGRQVDSAATTHMPAQVSFF